MPNSYFVARRRHDGIGITGIISAAMPANTFVNYDDAAAAEPTLKKATATRGFALLREVKSADDVSAQVILDQVFPHGAPICTPAVIGDTVAASKILEAELEGPDYLLTSGTGLLNASTALGSKLTTNTGRLAVVQSTEELCGYLRGKLAVEDSDNTIRALVEFV